MGNEGFHVPMDCFDEAERHELVGTYIFNEVKDTFQHCPVGLYRKDGLAVVKSLFSLEIEVVKKRAIKTFEDCRLKITIKANWKIESFLDVIFNLHKNTYKSYRRPNN